MTERGIYPGNPADRHQRLAGQIPRAAHAFEANHRIRIRFARSRKDRPDGQIVRWTSYRPRAVVRDCAWKRRASDSGPMIVRADSGDRSSCPTCTPSKSAARQRSARSFMISSDVVCHTRFLQFPRLLQHLPRVARLVAVLQKRAATSNQLLRSGKQFFRRAKTAASRMAIQARQRNHSFRSPLPAACVRGGAFFTYLSNQRSIS